MQKVILILDCGSTNVKACLMNTGGRILSSFSLPNHTVSDPIYPGGLIWDFEDIWGKLVMCSRKACEMSADTEIIAVTVTTFGVDGTAMKKNGSLCYPVISWQCSRTQAIEKNIGKYYDPDWLYRVTGLQSYHFNTIHKLIWLRENRPDILESMDYFVLLPSIILHRISGEFVTDATMAGTSMLTDNKKRGFSGEILKPMGINISSFPPWTEPGTVIGKVTALAADALGIEAGIAVIASGHDTQFAILGSGAGVNQPILSSGTWDILMVRTLSGTLQIPPRNSGVTIELDATPGLVNPGVQWVTSGVLEWISGLLYPDLTGDSRYSAMIMEAGNVPPGCDGLVMIPELFPGGFSSKQGSMSGFTHETTRAHIYRAGLEALSYYLAYGLGRLQQAGNYLARDLICVGGGSKNRLWNQIRADILGIPVRAIDLKETTALGAGMVACTGLGIYKSTEEAFGAVESNYDVYLPGNDKDRYKELYSEFVDKVFG